MTIKVKPLVWSPDDEEYCAGSHDNLVGICEYSIYPHPCAIGFFVLDVMGNRCDQDFPTIEDAKAAAQADYEARILSAIEAVDPATIRAEALPSSTRSKTMAEFDPATSRAESLRGILDDMWNLINSINDEDFQGMVPGRTAKIFGHYEKYHRLHIERAQQIAERLAALIDKEKDK